MKTIARILMLSIGGTIFSFIYYYLLTKISHATTPLEYDDVQKFTVFSLIWGPIFIVSLVYLIFFFKGYGASLVTGVGPGNYRGGSVKKSQSWIPRLFLLVMSVFFGLLSFAFLYKFGFPVIYHRQPNSSDSLYLFLRNVTSVGWFFLGKGHQPNY